MTKFNNASWLGAVLGTALMLYGQLGAAIAVPTTVADHVVNASRSASTKAVAVPKRVGRRLADVSESFKLLPNAGEGAAFDNMGYAVAVSGDTAVVGAHQNDEGAAINAGSAYVFVRAAGNAWTRQQRLVAPVPTTNDSFGFSVAISGDTLAIGAPFDDSEGAVYVYTRTAGSWTLQQRVVSLDIAAGDNFGYSVSIDGDTLAVGANLDTASTANVGSVYMFARSGATWSQQQRLLASDGVTGDQFGASVSLSGTRVIAGAPKDDNPFGAQAGAAYVYLRIGNLWTEEAKLWPLSSGADSEFGTDVTISGSTAVVGQPFINSNAGRATVFVENMGTWSLQTQLVASDAAANDFFGHSVALSGDLVVIGAYVDDLVSVVNAGSAYVYRRTGGVWTELDKYIASDASLNDAFGFGVALAGGTAIVGAPMDDVTGVGTDAGSAYVFNNGTATTTSLNVSSNSLVFGQSLTLTAQVSGGTPTGSVTFLNGAANLGTLALDGGGQAQLVLSSPNAGSYSITANYSGDSNHLTSSSAAAAVTVAKATTTMVLNSSSISAPYGQLIDYTATLSVTLPGGGTPTGNVIFSDGGTPIASVPLVAGTATLSRDNLPVGTHNITAAFAATTNYLGSSAGPIAQQITQAIVTMVLTSAPNPSVAGNTVTLTATLTGGIPTGTVAFQFVSPTTTPIGNASMVNGVATINTPALAEGTYVFQAFYTGDANNAFTSAMSPNHIALPAANLSITKSNGSSDVVQSGSTTVYTIVVTNNGPTGVIGATVADDIDAALFDEAAALWTCTDDGVSTCSSPGDDGDVTVMVDLPASSSATIVVTVPVLATSESGISNTATVTLPAEVGDPDLLDNSATDTDRSGLFGDGFED